MGIRPPPIEDGEEGIRAFEEALKLSEGSLPSKTSREFYRRDLRRWHRLYDALATKREPGTAAALHFARLSAVCSELLATFGEEPPPRPRERMSRGETALTYPAFSEDLTHRVHFFEGPALRRRRALQLASYADAVFEQRSGTGRVLVSVGIGTQGGQLFERLIHALGESGFAGDLKKAGFATGHVFRPPDAGSTWTYTPPDPASPLARVWADNEQARRYLWQARALGDLSRLPLPDDVPAIPGSLPWDPDPRFQQILDLTHTDMLREALALVEALHPEELDVLFDEVLYLRFLVGSPVRAPDIWPLAKKYALASTIAGRLNDEFEAFLTCLNGVLEIEKPPLTDLSRLRSGFGDAMIPQPPPPNDWPAIRAHLEQFAENGSLRGRIFTYNIDLGAGSIEAFFAPFFMMAENAFRRDRAIPEIGRGWASEVALLDLVRDVWPSAQHQWRPGFLGLQSVDIYVADLVLAIEYQGQQHYEPVALFGGEEGFRSTSARDERKRTLLAANGIRLIEWRYDVPITHDELRRAAEAVGVEI